MKADDYECTKARGTDDSQAEEIAGLLFTGAMVALGTYMADKAFELAKKEKELADKYFDLAQNWMNHYENTAVPVENAEVGEWGDLKNPETDGETPAYEAARGRARVSAWLQWKGATQKAFRCTSKYCTGLRKDILTGMGGAQASALAMAEGLGYRNERAYLKTLSDVRFKKKMAILHHGRNMVGGAADFGTESANIYGSMVPQVWEGVKNVSRFAGYFANRAATAYTQTFLGGEAYTQGEVEADFYMRENDPRVALNRAIGYGGSWNGGTYGG